MFTETYLPTVDGVVTSLLPIRRELERRGHEVFIFAPGDEEVIRANTDDHVIISKGRDFRSYPEYHISIARMKIRKLVRDLDLDVVHSHGVALMGMRAVWAARTNRLPLAFTYHTRVDEAASYISPPGRPQRIMQKLIGTHVNWYLRRCNVVIAPSQETADFLKAQSAKNIRRIEVVPNGVDLSRFSGKPARDVAQRFGVVGKTIFLTAGRIAKEKSLETLIGAAPRIAARIPNAHFVVVGKGPAREECEASVRTAGLSDRFTFTGYLDDRELAGFYATSHVFLLPSRLETQAMVVLEAMHHGLVSVCAQAGGVRDYVREGVNGYFYAPQDPVSLASKAVAAVSAPSLLREKARETANRYSVESSAGQLIDIYTSLLSIEDPTRPASATPDVTKA